MVFAKAARRGDKLVLIKVAFFDEIPQQLAAEDEAVDDGEMLLQLTYGERVWVQDLDAVGAEG